MQNIPRFIRLIIRVKKIIRKQAHQGHVDICRRLWSCILFSNFIFIRICSTNVSIYACTWLVCSRSRWVIYSVRVTFFRWLHRRPFLRAVRISLASCDIGGGELITCFFYCVRTLNICLSFFQYLCEYSVVACLIKGILLYIFILCIWHSMADGFETALDLLPFLTIIAKAM